MATVSSTLRPAPPSDVPAAFGYEFLVSPGISPAPVTPGRPSTSKPSLTGKRGPGATRRRPSTFDLPGLARACNEPFSVVPESASILMLGTHDGGHFGQR